MGPSGVSDEELDAITDRLVEAFDAGALLDPISRVAPGFDTDDAYAVLARIAAVRAGRGWTVAGRKIGFTNRTLWDLYGVDRPFWAHVWNETLATADRGRASVAIGHFQQPRIEPEVAFGLRGPVPVSDNAEEILSAVEWMAPAFEIVQCPYPEWRFTIAECAAAFGLHGRLVIGARIAIDDGNRADVAARLTDFEATLARDGEVVDRGVGTNVLDSPALALGHLARVVADQPRYGGLAAGEVVTTGTITNAHAIAPGETWTSDYGELALEGLAVAFT